MLDEGTINKLKTSLRGSLLLPGDAGYDDARSVFNGMIDRRPAMIAQCTGTADVIACVNFAHDNDIRLSVKGGGHGVAGKAVCDDGLVIDLSLMRSVRVSRVEKTAQVQAGARLGDLDHETQAFGLAVPAGVDSRTGVAGLALGGGNGHLARRFGLTADNLLAADVVTADGNLVRASETEHPDLLWALKGGGGNFGVVTMFEFRLHDVGPEILTAQAFHLFDDVADVLRFYRDFMTAAPYEVGCAALVLRIPPTEPFPKEHHGKMAVGLVANYSAGIEDGKEQLKPVEEFGNPIFSVMMAMPFTALQSVFDDGYPEGARYYWKSHYLRELPDAAIDSMVAETGSMPGDFTAFGFETMGGAVNQVDPTATAFPHRNAAFNFAVFGGWTDPAQDDEVIAWSRALHDCMEPYSTGGSYVNYMQDEAGDQMETAYGANYDRLRRVKSKYDPDGLFDAHQRIGTK